MNFNNLQFSFPKNCIALKPKKPRDASNLVEVNHDFKIHKFRKILHLLAPGDCLVFNNTKVIPGLLKGVCLGRKIEITLNKQLSLKPSIKWSAFCKPLRKVKKNDQIIFSENFHCSVTKIIRENSQSYLILEFKISVSEFYKQIKKIGFLALPPYITKKRFFDKSDIKDYQTIFSKHEGAIAAPTASLHFSKNLIQKLEQKGVLIVFVTLHVNGATFLPIRENNICQHKMHFEYGKISTEAANIMNQVKRKKKKLIAVGTTVIRLLESSKSKKGKIKPFEGETNLFIKPGWLVNTVDALITNFHTPNSTLLLLIYSLIGEEKTRNLYNFAINKKLRFFSYGDACLLWLKNDKKNL